MLQAIVFFKPKLFSLEYIFIFFTFHNSHLKKAKNYNILQTLFHFDLYFSNEFSFIS